jgi:hypothetical protein
VYHLDQTHFAFSSSTTAAAVHYMYFTAATCRLFRLPAPAQARPFRSQGFGFGSIDLMSRVLLRSALTDRCWHLPRSNFLPQCYRRCIRRRAQCHTAIDTSILPCKQLFGPSRPTPFSLPLSNRYHTHAGILRGRIGRKRYASSTMPRQRA